MKKLSIREIQLASLEILKKVHAICEEQHLTYWVMYGSLIGVIRHKGFIPWDDDFDIAMPRKDYDKLLQYFEDHSAELQPLKMDRFDKTENYPFYISRVTDTRYFLRFYNRKYTSGAFVDIYPLDGVGTDEEVEKYRQRVPKLKRLLKHLTLSCYPSVFYGDTVFHKIGNLPNSLYSKACGRLTFLEKLDRIAREYSWEESTYVTVKTWEVGTQMYRKEWFNEKMLAPFEDTEVWIPKEYDIILKEVYGDYMQLPPKEQRIPHHEYEAYLKED